jgi:hypothetical protein
VRAEALKLEAVVLAKLEMASIQAQVPEEKDTVKKRALVDTEGPTPAKRTAHGKTQAPAQAAGKEPEKIKEKPEQEGALSPKDEYFKLLDKAISDHGCLGSMLIVGVDSNESDEDYDEDEHLTAPKELTADQVAKLRHILINDSRDAALKAALDFVMCGQADDFIKIFNTSDGNNIVFGIPIEVKKALKKKTLPQRFDALFALTYGLKTTDFWMNDNECWGPGGELELAIKTLAKTWRNMLKRSDGELGIDTEFTRRGIVALLEEFEKDIRACDGIEIPFKWRP